MGCYFLVFCLEWGDFLLDMGIFIRFCEFLKNVKLGKLIKR